MAYIRVYIFAKEMSHKNPFLLSNFTENAILRKPQKITFSAQSLQAIKNNFELKTQHMSTFVL